MSTQPHPRLLKHGLRWMPRLAAGLPRLIPARRLLGPHREILFVGERFKAREQLRRQASPSRRDELQGLRLDFVDTHVCILRPNDLPFRVCPTLPLRPRRLMIPCRRLPADDAHSALTPHLPTRVQALALRVIAERLEHREAPAEFVNVTFETG
jgi:hypothetical protein